MSILGPFVHRRDAYLVLPSAAAETTGDVPKPLMTAQTPPAPAGPQRAAQSLLARIWRPVTRAEATAADVVSKPTRHTL
jgi:hypothetical protein